MLSLEGLSTFHSSRDILNRKRKRQLLAQRHPNKRSKTSADNTSPTSHQITSSDVPNIESDSLAQHPPPAILPHLIIGINQVTKRLESQARTYRETIALNDQKNTEDPIKPIRVVFVCRADVDPPLLIAHLPTLVASCNSSRRVLTNPAGYPPVKLIPLPLGAEFALAEATGLRRLSIIALDADTPDLDSFNSLLDSVPILRESWLTPAAERTSQSIPLISTHIKQTRTTAPKDLKAAKEQRTQGKAKAKRRKKQTQVTVVVPNH